MDIFIPLVAAVLYAGSYTLDKVVLSMRGVNYKTYVGISFPLSFVITAILFLIFRPSLTLGMFSGYTGLLLLFSIALLICGNLIFFRALDDDSLGEIQIIDLFNNVPLMIFTYILFSDERRPAVMLFAFISCAAIIWSHWEHRHFKLAKKSKLFLLWSLLGAPTATVVAKSLLVEWDPISLGLVQSGAVALILVPMFRKKARAISSKAFFGLLVTTVIASVSWILCYASYQRSGVIFTILIYSISSLLVYLASMMVLKERFHWKKAVAFGVVLLSICLAQLMS
jgi:drug/metabolite transporter (DMT)-like permease